MPVHQIGKEPGQSSNTVSVSINADSVCTNTDSVYTNADVVCKKTNGFYVPHPLSVLTCCQLRVSVKMI